MPEISKIQYGVHTINAGTITTDITLGQAFTTGKYMIKLMGEGDPTGGLTDPSSYNVRGALTSSTNIRLTRVGNTKTIKVNWQITEFGNGVTVQTGLQQSDAFSAVTNTTISSVNTSNTIVTAGVSTYNTSDLYNIFATYTLTSSTNLQFQGGSTYNFNYWQWYVVEFDDTTVYRYTGTTASTTSTNVALSPTVDTSKTWTLLSQRKTSTLSPSTWKIGYLTSSSNYNLTSYSNSAVTYNIQICYSNGVYVQRNNISGTTSSFNVSWINEVSWDNTITNLPAQYGQYAAYNSATTLDDCGYFLFRADKTTGFAAVVYRGLASPGVSVAMHFEVVEFIGRGGPSFTRRNIWLIT